MVIVTGGAGFIGSASIFALNRREEDRIILVDNLDHPRKERNVRPLRYRQLVSVNDFAAQLHQGLFDRAGVTGVIHLGACSDTNETDWDYLQSNNVTYSQSIIRWCVERGIRCVYASSAATYGDGRSGFSDDHDLFDRLEPLNPYGKSKLLLDLWARDQGLLDYCAGIRYFNVFGPNEWHKKGMRSVVNKKFDELRSPGAITLFKSYQAQYCDGAQERDFIYVKDAVDITLWLLDHPQATGIFNVGSGCTHTWNDLAYAMFAAVAKPPRIHYVDMPPHLKDQYQYHTKADLTKLRSSGCSHQMASLEDTVSDYIRNYLMPDKHFGE